MSIFEAYPVVSGLLLFGVACLNSRLSTPRAAARPFVDPERDARRADRRGEAGR